MRRAVALVLVGVVTLATIGCATHIHTIGNGPQGNQVQQARQWYILWGLVPLNQVDTGAMAGTATDYEIITQQSVLDFIIGIPASWITVSSRTVTVTK